MWFSPDCSTCSVLYDLGRNENFARSQKANLNYLICLKLYDFLFSFSMHYGFLWKDSVNKQDTCFRSCKIPDPSNSFKAFRDAGHVIRHKHPAPIVSPIPLGQHLWESPLGSALHETPSTESSRKKKKRWALRVHKELLGTHNWLTLDRKPGDLDSGSTLPCCMTLDKSPNF